MNAARATMLALGFALPLCAIHPRTASAQMTPDSPTGGTSARQAQGIERPVAAAPQAGFAQLFLGLRSRAVVYAWVARAAQRPVGEPSTFRSKRRGY
jgi:hypothetical protein